MAVCGCAKGVMSSRRRGSSLGSGRKIVLVLLTLLVPSETLSGGSAHTWRCCGQRVGWTRCPRSVAARAGAPDIWKMCNDGGDSSRSGEAELEEMGRWLDETGVDRRGGEKGTPSAKLRRFSGRGIGLEAAVDLERDSTVSTSLVPARRTSSSSVCGRTLDSVYLHCACIPRILCAMPHLFCSPVGFAVMQYYEG